MKKILFVAVCLVSVCAFTSCGSTAPCGLSENTKKIQLELAPEILVTEATVIE